MNRRYLLSFALALGAVPLDPGSAAETAIEQKAKDIFASTVREYKIPGLVVGATQNGRHSFYSYGFASLADQRPVSPDTIFELGSVSKLFTATLAAIAEQKGELSLDDTVAKHLCSNTCRIGDDITLMDLATHHSGGLPLQVPDEVDHVDKMAAWLKIWKPTQPGARSYSNVSIGMLGHITSKSMGMTYENTLKAELLTGLGLSNTWITVSNEAIADYAYGYDKTDQAIRVNPGVLDAEAYGIKSTARDMLTFLDAQLGQREVPADIKTAIARTHEGQFRTAYFTQDMIWEQYEWPVDEKKLISGNAPDFILNPQREDRIVPALPPQKQVLLNKTGSTNGFGAYVAFLPDKDLGVVVLANRNYPNEARVKATYALINALVSQE
ncbi:beta-lactamase family protein [Ochrobactrum quorumnocens]|uniref:Beta-lactamase n=1 Tax=Ochrobactrum quorumnocens TaxID=271865 RepID=A0A248UI34_9HYPH|nr:class C beta-lactamase [[Ochrobactrum] quorumnocens]ASV86503.1 beta-lactamase family protein [[Ochrobactrum] quorumnocens]